MASKKKRNKLVPRILAMVAAVAVCIGSSGLGGIVSYAAEIDTTVTEDNGTGQEVEDGGASAGQGNEDSVVDSNSQDNAGSGQQNATDETETESETEPEKETEKETEKDTEEETEAETEKETETEPEPEKPVRAVWYEDGLEVDSLKSPLEAFVEYESVGLSIDPEVYGIQAAVNGQEVDVLVDDVRRVSGEPEEIRLIENGRRGICIAYDSLKDRITYEVIYRAKGTNSTITKQFYVTLLQKEIEVYYPDTSPSAPSSLSISMLDLSQFSDGNGLKIRNQSTTSSYSATGASWSKASYASENTGACTASFTGLSNSSVVNITYDNIGTYNDRAVGVKVTFTELGSISTLYYCETSYYNGWWLIGHDSASRAQAKFTYFYTDTKETIRFDGNSFMTFNSLNSGEYVSPLNGATAGYTATSTNVAVTKVSGIPTFRGSDNNFTDYLGGATFYKNSVSIPLYATGNTFYLGCDNHSGYWIAPSSASIAIPRPENPYKTENGVTFIEETEEGQTITYRISQKVHTLGVETVSKYSALKFVDQLPVEVDYISAWLENGSGSQLNAGTVEYDPDSHKVTYTFSASFLASGMAYQGESYTLVINTTVNGIAESDYFYNSCKIYFNSMSVESNEVKAASPYRTVEGIVENGRVSIYDGDGNETVPGEDDWKVDDRVKFHHDRTVRYEPDEGYLLDTVTVDGEKVDITKYPSSYTFRDVTQNHKVTAVYAKPTMDKEVQIKDSDCLYNYADQQVIDGLVIKDGDTVTYTISFDNPTSITRNVEITDNVPVGMEVIPDSISDGGIYDAMNHTVTWTGKVDAYGSGAVSFDCQVLFAAQGEIMENTGTVCFKAIPDSSEKDVSVSDTTNSPILEDPVKSVWNKDGEDITNKVINDQEKITYTITFKNPAKEAKVFTVTDEIPAEVSLVEGTVSDGGLVNGSKITWKMTLAAGQEKTVSFDVYVPEMETEYTKIYNQAEVGVDYTQKVSISSDSVIDEKTPVYVLDDPFKVVLCADGHDIGADSEGNLIQTVKQAGDILEYRITFQNPADDARIFTITDALPENVEFVSADHDGSYETGTHTVTWSVSVMENTPETVSVKVRILKEAEDTILKNHATVEVDYAKKVTNEVETPVIPTPKKDVFSKLGEQSINTYPVQIGENLIYTVTYKNPSDYDKIAVITDRLPEDVKFISASDGGSYDAETHTVTWTMEVGAHASGMVSVKVKVLDSATSKTIENQAYVDMDEAHIGTVVDNDGREDEYTRNFVPGKHVLDADGRDINEENVAVGDIVTYQITYKNDGYTTRTVTINDILPAGVSFVDASDNGKVYSVVKGDNLRWSFEIEPGTESCVTVRVKVGEELLGKAFANSAAVTITDEETGQEKSADTNQVVNYVLESLVKYVKSANGKKDLNGESVESGTQLQYQIAVKNTAVEERTFVITDEVPEGCKFVSAGNGGSLENGVVTWTVTLAGGESTTVSFLAEIQKAAEGGCVQNVAKISYNGVTLTSNRVRTYVEKPDTLLDDLRDLLDKNGDDADRSVTVNVDNSNTNSNEAAGGSSNGTVSGNGISAQDNKSAGNNAAGNETTDKAVADAVSGDQSDGKEAVSALMMTNPPKTGDDSRIGLWAAFAGILLLTGCGFAGFAVYKVKKKGKIKEITKEKSKRKGRGNSKRKKNA